MSYQYESEDAHSEGNSSISSQDSMILSYGQSDDEGQQQNENSEHSDDDSFEVKQLNELLKLNDDHNKKLQKEDEKIRLIPHQKRQMINILSKYEKAKVLGMRASQIASNSPIYVTLPKGFSNISALQIAELELKQKMIPFIIRRFYPDGSYQEWKISQLEIIE